MPMNSGRFLSALRYSTSGYWNSWIDCQRHMLRFGLVPDTSPFGVTPEFSQVVFGRCPRRRARRTGRPAWPASRPRPAWQLRLPLPPWPACTNQSRPQGVSTLSVAFLISFCIEIEPSEQVVWLWKSPATYVPGVRSATVQLTCAVIVAGAGRGSPSLTVTVTVAMPGVLQVNVGFARVAVG